MNRPLAALACWLALVPALSATCRVHVHRPVFHKPVVAVVKKVIVEPVAAFFAVPLVAPLYPTAVPAGYAVPPGAPAVPGGLHAPAGGGAAGAWTGPSQQQWQQLLQALTVMQQDIQALKGAAPRGAGAALPPAGPPAAAAAAAGGPDMPRCAACHDKATAQAKGGGHVFFGGGKLTAEPKQALKMVKAILSGTMPLGADGKPAPLDDQTAQGYVDRLTK
jgi:hypothetical protein